MKGLVLTLLLAASPALAAEGYRTGRFELSLDPGAAIPLESTSDQLKNAVTLQITGAYQFHQWATAGLEMGWQFGHHLGGQTSGQLAEDYTGDGIADRVSFGSNIREKVFQLYPFIKVGQWTDVVAYKFRPYLLFGAGLYHVWTNSGNIVIEGYDQISGKHVGPVTKSQDTSSNSYFGFNTGGGFEVQVDENAAIGFDLRFSRVIKPYDDFQFLTPSLRILYLF
jgi:opacity protein-like surface antigen